MAKIKFSALVSDLRGKLNGSVFSKNRSGNYIRNKVTPVNPQTAAQSRVRSMFGKISQAWRSLSDAQRASWNNSVQKFAETDIFGDMRNPSGKALFQKLNQNLLLVGQSMLNSCPSPADVGSFSIESVVFNEEQGGLTLTTVSDGSLLTYTVEATPPLSSGQTFAKNSFRRIGVYSSTGDTPIQLLEDYEAKFGTLSGNPNVQVQVFVTNGSGQVSPRQSIKVEVASMT